MKIKTALAFIVIVAIPASSFAQFNRIKEQGPCYTRHWVDSVNSITANRIEAGIPNLVNWYTYEGQKQPCPAPSLIVNVIWVRVEDECPANDSAE